MRALDLFTPWITPHVYGAPEPLIHKCLRDAATEFSRRSAVDQSVVVANVVAGTASYAITPPDANKQLAAVLDVYMAERCLRPVSFADTQHGAAVRAGTDTVVPSVEGDPQYYYQITPADEVIYLWPRPAANATGALAIKAAFEPTPAAAELADVLYDTYREAVAAGAVARLVLTPGHPFTNPAAAPVFQSVFDRGVADAVGMAHRASTRAPLRVKQRAFL